MFVTISRVLLIREPWLSLILSGEKVWEMRKMNTKIRGFIGLSQPGSGVISGVANLTGVLPEHDEHSLALTQQYHRVPPGNEFSHYNRPWVLEQAQRLVKPISYEQKPGAVVWVKTPPRRVKV